MKKTILFLLLITFWVACKLKVSNQNISIANYYAYHKNDSLLVDIVSYIDKLPENVTPENRFNATNRAHYIEGFKTRHRFVNYYIDKEGVNYFISLVKVPSLLNKKRLVGGQFKMVNNKIISFEEKFITQKLDEKKLLEINDSLFMQLIEKRNIDSTYIEWPNKHIFYNPKTNTWDSR